MLVLNPSLPQILIYATRCPVDHVFIFTPLSYVSHHLPPVRHTLTRPKPAIPSCFMTLSHCLPSSGISWSSCDTSDHGLLQLTTSFDDRTLGLSPYLRASIYQPYCQVTHYTILRACPWVCQSLCTYPWFAYHTLPRT